MSRIDPARWIPVGVLGRPKGLQGLLWLRPYNEDIAALRKFVGLSQEGFAAALGISVHTLRNWEQGRRKPEGPALALLRIAARHPHVVRENVTSAA